MSSVINLSAREPVMPEFSDYGVCLLESRHTHGFTMAASAYDFSEVMLVLDGSGWVHHAGVRHPVRKGHLIIVPSGDAYFFEDDPKSPLAMLCLCVRQAAFPESLILPVLPRRFQVRKNPLIAQEIASHLRAILYAQSRRSAEEASVVIGHTLLLLAKLAVREVRKDAISPRSREVEIESRVRDYIEKLKVSFHEPETIELAAGRLGISPRSLTHYFRKITGISRLRFIRGLQLAHARRLLSETGQSVTSIGFACGFEDLSNFFRAFRREEGQSPNLWREANQKRSRLTTLR